MTDGAIKIRVHSERVKVRATEVVIKWRGSSHPPLGAALKQSEERGVAGGGSGKGKGMMFLPRCSAGSGWGVQL